jgi:hypothetical protein
MDSFEKGKKDQLETVLKAIAILKNDLDVANAALELVNVEA